MLPCPPFEVDPCIISNLCRYTTKAFGPLMAKAAKVTIVEAENIVEIGEIDPNDVDLPGIFVDRVVPATTEKKIEVLKLRDPADEADVKSSSPKNPAQEKRNRIGRRASEELKEGYYVNLGVGMRIGHLTTSAIVINK